MRHSDSMGQTLKFDMRREMNRNLLWCAGSGYKPLLTPVMSFGRLGTNFYKSLIQSKAYINRKADENLVCNTPAILFCPNCA